MKRIYLLVFVIFGFLLVPTGTFACGNHSGKNSCSNKSSANTETMDCCKKDSHSKTKNHEGCGGKCKNSKCGCVSSCNSSTVAVSELNTNGNLFNFGSEKIKFYNYETSISSGFNSLWLIPKIS